MKPLLISLVVLVVCLTASFGRDLSQEQVSQMEDIRLLQEKSSQLQTDLQAFKDENKILSSEISDLKSSIIALQKSNESFRKEIEQIHDLIQKIDSAREKDRKTIVEEVGREIDRLTKKSSEKPSLPKSVPPRTQKGVEHLVEKGQTLVAIAKAYGVSQKSIMEANQMTHSELKTGQKLFIPQENKPPSQKH